MTIHETECRCNCRWPKVFCAEALSTRAQRVGQIVEQPRGVAEAHGAAAALRALGSRGDNKEDPVGPRIWNIEQGG